LFWDHLQWPQSNEFHLGHTVDTQYLEERGVLSRPSYKISGDVGSALAESYLQCFFENEKHNPGNWAVSTGDNSLLLKSKEFSAGRGESVELVRAIPIPDADVPLEEVISFKEKRKDEVRSIQLAINELYSSWTGAEDQEHQLQLSISKIEEACANIVQVAREDKNPFRLSNWTIGFGLNAIGILGAAEFGAKMGTPFGLEQLGRLLGGAASTITLSKNLGFTNDRVKSSPFRYAASLERDVI